MQSVAVQSQQGGERRQEEETQLPEGRMAVRVHALLLQLVVADPQTEEFWWVWVLTPAFGEPLACLQLHVLVPGRVAHWIQAASRQCVRTAFLAALLAQGQRQES